MKKTREYVAEPADLPRGTLVDLFLDAAERFSGEEAFRHKVAGEWVSISQTEFGRDVQRLHRAMQVLGVERGDRVAILSENRPEWAMADFAALCLGAYDVPVYPNLPAEQVQYLLENSGARLIFVDTVAQLEKIRSIRAELPALQHVIAFDHIETGEAERTLSAALEQGEREMDGRTFEQFADSARQAAPDDIATILYTSGTTGQPKGVMLTHNNIFSNTRAVDGVLPITTEDVALSLLPLSHIFERTVDYFLFSKGCTIAYAESIETVPDNLVEVKPTIVASVPRLYEKIYTRVMSATGVRGKLVGWAFGVGKRWADAKLNGRTPPLRVRMQYPIADRLVFSKLRQGTGGRLRFFVSGGGALNESIARFFYSANVLILEGYGLTETSPVTNVNRPDRFRFGTVGPPVPGTEISIAEDGEILVRGPQVMKGYYKDPEATAEVLTADGWFHTGDIGEIDEEGCLRITDRKKDILVTAGGKNVAPQPIENRIKMNPFVAEAVMLGDRRPYTIVLIVPDAENLRGWAAQNGVTADGLSELLADERVRAKMQDEVNGALAGLASYETPHKIGLLVQEFGVESGELTPSLKVKRRVVEEREKELIEAMYSSERHEVVHVAGR